MPVERFTESGDADEADAAPRDEAVPNTGSARRLLKRLKLPAGVGVCLAVGILAYFLLTGPLGRPRTGMPAGDVLLVQLDPQTVNLAEPGMSLEVQMTFEASSPEFGALLRRRTAQLADIAITVISTKTVSELDSELERNRLKRELADAVAQRVRSDEAHVTNVYFTRFHYRLD
jgi:flagellar basal body-associated protein FliL